MELESQEQRRQRAGPGVPKVRGGRWPLGRAAHPPEPMGNSFFFFFFKTMESQMLSLWNRISSTEL